MISALAFGSGTELNAVIWSIDTGFVSLEKVSLPLGCEVVGAACAEDRAATNFRN